MESGTVLTVGLVGFALALVFFGWRAARWLTNFADGLKNDIRADIKEVKDEFTTAQKALTEALSDARTEFERVVKEMGETHAAFREKTLDEFRLLERDVAGFKLTVAQQYASKGDMQQSVQIILARIEGLAIQVQAIKDGQQQR